jgi:site-specific DNA-cytosine methylase
VYVSEECQPPAVILENVKGLGRVLSEVVKILEGIGPYLVEPVLLNPVDYGWPTSRPRYYILMVRNDRRVMQIKLQNPKHLHLNSTLRQSDSPNPDLPKAQKPIPKLQCPFNHSYSASTLVRYLMLDVQAIEFIRSTAQRAEL